MSSTTDNEQRFAYLLSPEFQIVNTAGKPLTGGWIEVYIHGTRVKYYCFSDFDGTLHPFQIPLDSLGSNIVLASPTHAYDIYIYNKFGALVMSRYNVVPACNAADIVEDVVVIDSPNETINVTCDGGSNWHLEVNTDLIATASGLAEVSGALTEVSGALLNKKDKQEPIDVSGSVTKTVTNIKQNENGEIEITYEDIDLPQQVPNVNIISPSGTLDISSTTDPTTNTKTFKIDVHKSNMDYFEGYYGRAHYEDRPSDTTAAFTTYVDQWREYRYQGDFIANSWQDENNTNFLLNSGLYLITASIRYKMTDASVKNKEEYIRIATGAFNGLENGTQLKDWSNEAALDENTIQLSFVRSVDDDEDYDYLRGNHTLYFAPYLPYGVNYAEIDHLQIVKLDSIVTYHGGPGPMYKPGYGIEIQDDVISVATGTVVTNNYFNTVVSSINNEINEINTTIQNVTGDITELSETVTNIVGVTGDFATNEDLQIVSGAIPESQEVEFQELDVDSLATTEYVDNRIASAAGDVYEAGQYVSIENNVINVTGVQPAGDYATNEDLQIVSGAIPESEAVEFEELDLAQFAQASAITVIQNQINNVTGDINNINEAVTNIIGATGDYATEEYVDEAIAAVTGQPLEQQQSDWTQYDDTKVDYIKHKPREVNLVAGNNIAIEQQDLDVIISATGIPSLEGYATEQYVDEAVSGLENYEAGQYVSIQNHVINVTGVQPEGNYATEEYVDEAVAAVTGQSFEQVNSDWLATSGVAEILNKPDVFQLIAGDNIDITPSGNDLVISASSDVTKAYVDEQIAAVSAAVPEAQVNSDWNATSGKAEILNKPQEEEVEFEEVNLSDYALASAIPDVSNFVTQQDIDNSIVPVQSQIDELAAATGDYITSLDGYATEQYVNDAIDTATGMIPDVSNLEADIQTVSGKLPTTELGKFTINSNVSGGPIEVLVPTDQAPDAVFYQINSVSGNAYTSSYSNAVINYYYGETPADFNGSDDYILFTINDSISNIGSISFYYTTAETGMGGPNLTTTSITGGSTGIVQSDTYRLKAQYNQAGTSSPYGKYLQIMFNWKNYSIDTAQSLQWAQEALSKITFFGVVRPDPSLGTIVNLDRYYLGGNIVSNKPTNSGLPAQIWLNPDTKKQEVYLPQSIPSSWRIYGNDFTNYTSTPTSIGDGAVNEIAYKYDSATGKYVYARMTCHINDTANNIKKAEFVTLEPVSGNFEKWTYDWSDYSNRHWTTETISSGSTYTAGEGIDITNDVISIDNTVALKSDIPVVTGFATKTEVQEVDAKVDAVSASIPELPSEEEVEFEELDLSIYALASAVPDTTQLETDVANLVAATGNYATEQELADAIDAATGLIPDVSTLATKNELVSAIDILQDEIDNIPSGSSYTAGAGIDITNNVISVDNTVITIAASSVELPNANFGITHDGQAYKSIVGNVKQQVGYTTAGHAYDPYNLTGVIILNSMYGGAGYYPAGTYEIHVPIEFGDLYFYNTSGTFNLYRIYNGVVTWTLNNDLTLDESVFEPIYFEARESNTKVDLTESNSGLYLTNQHSNVNYALITDVPDVTTLATKNELASAVDILQDEIDNLPAGTTYTGASGVNVDNDTISLDDPIGVIAGQGITFTASGDDIIISSTSQVQADWTEDDSSDPSYIQNKPTEKNLVAGTNVTITETNDEVTIETTEIASGAELVAGSGINIEEVGNTIRISNDETVLFETSDVWGSINVTLSESFKNFERIAVLPTRYYHSDSSVSQRGGVGPWIYFDTADLYHSSADYMSICVYFFEVQWLKTSIYSASNDYKTLTWYKAISKDLTSTSAGTITTTNTDAAVGIKKVVGINRISN